MVDYRRRSFIRKASLIVATPWLGGLENTCIPGRQALQNAGNRHKILCCNIRVDLPEDEQKGFGWQARKDSCVQIIARHRPDIICLQEVLKNQMDDLQQAFPAFMALGFDGPEMDANPIGYHGIAKNPIMFSTERYGLVGAGCYWLSETPLVAGSISWESARARHANYVRLKDKQTGREFRVVNLHLDHKNQYAREQQIKVVLDEAAQYKADFPQLLAGDFNAGMANPVYSLVNNGGWSDSYTSIHGDTEPGYTVHLFKGNQYEKKDQGKKIDFIFFTGAVKSRAAEIIRDQVNGVYPSDHYFISAEVEL